MEAAHGITGVIKSLYDQPYVSWKKIPPKVREMWFNDFKVLYNTDSSFILILFVGLTDYSF